MPTIGQLHLASAIVALATGAAVLLMRKGTRVHRRVGWTYAGAMVALNLSALLIYRLTGVFGPFHVAAVASLATLIAGVLPVRRRTPASWLERHYFFMAYSYLGLLAATVAEVATRVPAVAAFAGGPTAGFWIAVAVSSALVFVVGGREVRRRVASTLAPFRGGNRARTQRPGEDDRGGRRTASG